MDEDANRNPNPPSRAAIGSENLWQPMGTAPMDGTWIEVRTVNGRIVETQYEFRGMGSEGRPILTWWIRDTRCLAPIWSRPEAWRPLPPNSIISLHFVHGIVHG